MRGLRLSNASAECIEGPPWTTAASLYIRGRANDGALCFNCANKRRENLGLSWEQRIEPPSPALECQATLKHVCINIREYSWNVSTLESLLTKWHDECLDSHFKNREIKFWIVAVNNEIIPATGFSSTSISDRRHDIHCHGCSRWGLTAAT